MGMHEIYTHTGLEVNDAVVLGTTDVVLGTLDLKEYNGALISLAIRGNFSTAARNCDFAIEHSDTNVAADFVAVTDKDVYGIDLDDLEVDADHTTSIVKIDGAYVGVKRYVRITADPGTTAATNNAVGVTMLGTGSLRSRRPA